MKKVLILYDTIYGNTKRVAMALSRGLEAGNFYVDCIPIQGFDIEQIKNYDVLGIGGPTHFHGASESIKSFLKKIRHLKMENKLGFAFETKGDFRLAGSAAVRIMRYLKKMKLKIIHPAITAIVLDKEGPLEPNIIDRIEQIGLGISEKLETTIYPGDRELKTSTFKSILNSTKWILIGGGPIFFFIRALYLATTGGDCFGTINPGCSWFLLILEITISGITGVTAILSLIFMKIGKKGLIDLDTFSLKNFILLTGVSSYITHFIRVAIWITLCIL
ncbi:MAG: flavodoxin domain-containing protein [Promethearchaeota archaeon]